ncbi:MAG TPA: von Willebrand factor type A domain-containing protein, partial [Thermoanaerobaculia bacterium]|nr:von Willebrand factor type A domain-containing protein [Thermoanaerobaculia bacterium]
TQGITGGLEGVGAGVPGGVLGGVTSRPGAPPPPALPAPPPAAARSKMRIMSAQNSAPMPSTGGSAEPNDQPYGDVFFESAGVNPFIDTEDDALSTFGLDVDTGSYSVARRYLTDGHLPPPASIRVEEFLNSFDYGDRPPQRGNFSISAEGGPWPYLRGQRYYGLRFGIHGREVSVAARKPATLIFTIDTSGSMAQQSRLETVKDALEILVEQLGRRDRIGLVTYGSSARVVLEPTGDHSAILRAIERLRPEGSTNVEEGLLVAYDLAGRYFREGEINRIILCSDGVANVGGTGHESILQRIGAAARRGIELTTVGFGMGNYNDVLMEQLANKGNGQYAYVDNLREARRIFEENLTSTLQTIARDAKVQVEFNPRTVASYRLLGYENRDIADHRFRDDRVDAGEIGAGHSVIALYEIKLQPRVRPGDEIATLHLRYKDVDGGDRVIETKKVVKVADLAGRWSSASESYRLASLVATFAEVLKRSYWAKEVSPSELARRIETLSEEMGTAKVNELGDLSRAAARLIPFEDEE